MAVLERAFVRLQGEFATAGKAELYDALRRLQADQADEVSQVQVAERLGLPLNTLKSHLLRFRHRYRELLCEEVAQTVATPAELGAEIRHLIRVVSGD
jgi:RNA polymerase sigma-70 factor (ECF subfamily)